MKKIIKLPILALAILMAMPSCKKFLQEVPPSNYSPDTYYQNSVQAQNAVNGIYAYTRYIYGNTNGNFDDQDVDMLEMPTSQASVDIHQSVGNAELLNLATSSANLYVLNWWKYSYQGIDAANLAIANIPKIPANLVTDQQKATLLGEAKFLRAWFYFNLVRIYGDVPLITTPTAGTAGLQVPRNPTKDIYENLIVPDLLAAEQSGLPFADHTGRASLGAVKSLLAKVYETMAGYPLQQTDKFALAKKEAADVINSGAFTLYQKYPEFNDPANDNLKENIFMIQFASGIASSPLFITTLPFPQVTSPNGLGALTVDATFYSSYAANDLRAQQGQYFYSHYLNKAGGTDVTFPNGQHIFKYFDPISFATNSPSGKCFSVIRLSDIMLLYAEAQNEADGSPDGNAYTYVNQIRARAGLAPVAGLSQTQFREAVWRERNHELCYENITWFDMVRTRTVYDTKNDAFVPMVGYTFPGNATATFATKNLLFPIPQSEIQANPKLVQNPGY
jgi:hypothetical protein